METEKSLEDNVKTVEPTTVAAIAVMEEKDDSPDVAIELMKSESKDNEKTATEDEEEEPKVDVDTETETPSNHEIVVAAIKDVSSSPPPTIAVAPIANVDSTLLNHNDDDADEIEAIATAASDKNADTEEEDQDEHAELTMLRPVLSAHSQSGEEEDDYDEDEKSESDDDVDHDEGPYEEEEEEVEDEDDDEPDEPEDDESDSDVQIISLDSSPEKSQSRNIDRYNRSVSCYDMDDLDGSEEEVDDDYDDDDLMNDVVSSQSHKVSTTPIAAVNKTTTTTLSNTVRTIPKINRLHKFGKRKCGKISKLRRFITSRKNLSIKRLNHVFPNLKSLHPKKSQIIAMSKPIVQMKQIKDTNDLGNTDDRVVAKFSKEEYTEDECKIFNLTKPSSSTAANESPMTTKEMAVENNDKCTNSTKKIVMNPFSIPRKVSSPLIKDDISEQNKENLQNNEKNNDIASKTAGEQKDHEVKDTEEVIFTEVVEPPSSDALKKDEESKSKDSKTIEIVPNIDVEDIPKPQSDEKRSKRLFSECNIDVSNVNIENNDNIHPAKKLKLELSNNFDDIDKVLTNYMPQSSSDTIESIQAQTASLIVDIQLLNEMIKATEIEWSKMLHLKNIKEEIYHRLTRKKQNLEIASMKIGEVRTNEDTQNHSPIKTSSKTISSALLSSTPLPTVANSSTLLNLTPMECNDNSSSTTLLSGTASSIIHNRANMKSSDLAKEKAIAQKIHRNILPKPSQTTATANLSGSANLLNQYQQGSKSHATSAASSNNFRNLNSVPGLSSSSNMQPILNNYLTSTQGQDYLGEFLHGQHNTNAMNGNNQPVMVGRQGVIKDVKSIIADYRQRHPETVPRRGRRVKGDSIFGSTLKNDTNSRPSSNDSSSHSIINAINNISTGSGNLNFQNVLAQFAKLGSQTERVNAASSIKNPISAGGHTRQAYPEVTLHPVSNSFNTSSDQSTGSSLLHGILTQLSRPNEATTSKTINSIQVPVSSNYGNNFSPTLARLLTTPDRITTSIHRQQPNPTHSFQMQGTMNAPGLNVVGPNNEITITPVMPNTHIRPGQQNLNLAAEDEAEDSVDRLVIDEGVDSMAGAAGEVEDHQRVASHNLGQDFVDNEEPVCQGCKKFEAQFMCAGCSDQWYCSRECQVTAWDDHSDVCTATEQFRTILKHLKLRSNERSNQYQIEKNNIATRKENEILRSLLTEIFKNM